MKKRILFLPGDGIGPEIVAQVRRVAQTLDQEASLGLEMSEALVGGAAISAQGTPLHEETLQLAKSCDAVLLGAVGGPAWDDLPFAQKPEQGLLRLRKDLGLFANLRPALCFPALASASTLKEEIISDLDILIVRELTGGVYFGEPRGITQLPDGQRRGVNTQVYTTNEILRVARAAFRLAQKRTGRVTSCEKSNVMESGLLWREEVQKLQNEEFPDIALSHMYADNCAMQLVRAPKQFDVILTDNLFGDILSDVAAMLTGSLGMLPSASLGENGTCGLYEPVHGSAPDIAGQNCANPLAAILSFALLLRYSLEQEALATTLETAVQQVLQQGLRTPDIAGQQTQTATTTEMGDAVVKTLRTTLQATPPT